MDNRKDRARQKRLAEKKGIIARAYKKWKSGQITYYELIVFISGIIGRTKDYSEKYELSAMLDLNWKEFLK